MDASPESDDRPQRFVRTVVSVVVGFVLFGLFLWQAAEHDVDDPLGALGWNAPLVLLPYALIAYVDTRGWRCTFPDPRSVPLWTLYLVRMAGEAVNSVTPAAAVGGEPVKAMLLRRNGVAGSDAVASLVITKTALTVTQALFVVLGCAALFVRWDLRGTGLAMLLGLLLLCAGFGFGLVRMQQGGPAKTLWRWLHRIAPRARLVGRLEHAAAAIDARLADFYAMENAAFFRASAWHMVGWLTGAFEVWFILWLMDATVPWTDALIIEALAQPIRATSIVVPGALGTQEGLGAAVCQLLGMERNTADALWILRRGRELVFDGAGLLYLAMRSARAGRA